MKSKEYPKENRKLKIARTIAGSAVLIVGVIAIPYPGPGWLIVFTGLAILAKDYPWAARLLRYTRGRYDAWNAWVRRQNAFVRSLTVIGTVVVVILTVWLVNGYGIINSWFHLDQGWLQSPFVRG